MTLDEKIVYEEEIVKDRESLAEFYGKEPGKNSLREKLNRKSAVEHRQTAEWLKELKALKQEPHEDCISRQAVLGMQYRIDDSASLASRDVVNADDIEELPSVTSAQKIGRWNIGRIFPTKVGDENLTEYRCSECDRAIKCTESQLVNYPYCHCGAKMEE